MKQFIYQGEIAAIGAAILWAVSSVVYTSLGQRIAPLQLNLAKGLIAIAFIIITLILLGQPIPQFDRVPVIFLLLSGVIGIGLGDTAYFSALSHLGARRTLLIETLAPPMTAVLATVFLGEELKAGSWFGIVLTILGVAWVIGERIPASVVSNVNPMRGIIWGILAAIAQSIGVLLSRFALVESDITPLWSTLLRLIGGSAIVLCLLLRPQPMRSQKIPTPQLIWSAKLIGTIVITAFGSTYLGIFLQQTSLKYAPAGIAQTLSSTSPLFILPIAFWMGDKISLRAILGVAIALAGIGILFSS